MVSEEMLQIMDERGTVLRPDLVPALSDVEWLGLYKAMVRARAADDRLQEAQREGRLLIYPPNTGQEAAQVGPAAAMGESQHPLDLVVGERLKPHPVIRDVAEMLGQ